MEDAPAPSIFSPSAEELFWRFCLQPLIQAVFFFQKKI